MASSGGGGTKKVLFLVGGSLLLLVGLALMVLPGPGIPLVIAGLAMLGQSSPRARSLAKKLRQRARRLAGKEAPRPEPAVKSSERPLLS
jgi:hypothetical protein